MSDKLYCPKCNKETKFLIKEVQLEVEGLPKEFAKDVCIVYCSECKSPIGSYTNNYYTEEKDENLYL